MQNSYGEHQERALTFGIHFFSFPLATQWNSLPSELKS
jgi:hypothetical protein